MKINGIIYSFQCVDKSKSKMKIVLKNKTRHISFFNMLDDDISQQRATSSDSRENEQRNNLTKNSGFMGENKFRSFQKHVLIAEH